jgi:hypothetical protein
MKNITILSIEDIKTETIDRQNITVVSKDATIGQFFYINAQKKAFFTCPSSIALYMGRNNVYANSVKLTGNFVTHYAKMGIEILKNMRTPDGQWEMEVYSPENHVSQQAINWAKENNPPLYQLYMEKCT